jgi:hypothetical protein
VDPDLELVAGSGGKTIPDGGQPGTGINLKEKLTLKKFTISHKMHDLRKILK